MYSLQMWLWYCGLPIGMQLLCSWRYLIYFFSYMTIIYDFRRWNLICIYSRLFTYIGPSIRWLECILSELWGVLVHSDIWIELQTVEWYKILLSHDCSMSQGLCMGIAVCLFTHLCVCEWMSKNGVFMKLQFILIISIVKCFSLSWRKVVISGTVHWFWLKTSFHPLLWMKANQMYCSRDYYFSSRFNQQYEKPTPVFHYVGGDLDIVQ